MNGNMYETISYQDLDDMPEFCRCKDSEVIIGMPYFGADKLLSSFEIMRTKFPKSKKAIWLPEPVDTHMCHASVFKRWGIRSGMRKKAAEDSAEALDKLWQEGACGAGTLCAAIIFGLDSQDSASASMPITTAEYSVSEELQKSLRVSLERIWGKDNVFISSQVVTGNDFILNFDDMRSQGQSALLDQVRWSKGVYDKQTFENVNQVLGICAIPVSIKITIPRTMSCDAYEQFQKKLAIPVMMNEPELCRHLKEGISRDMAPVSPALMTYSQTFRFMVMEIERVLKELKHLKKQGTGGI